MAIQRSFRSLVLIGTIQICLTGCGSGEKDVSENDVLVTGADIYSDNCVICHGKQGDAGISGANDLTVSNMDRKTMRNLILNGKGNMPPFSFLFEDDSTMVDEVIEHVISLRK